MLGCCACLCLVDLVVLLCVWWNIFVLVCDRQLHLSFVVYAGRIMILAVVVRIVEVVIITGVVVVVHIHFTKFGNCV